MTANESDTDGADGPDAADTPSTVRSHSRSTAIPPAAHVDPGRRGPQAWNAVRGAASPRAHGGGESTTRRACAAP